jgi:hypothetical protein
VTSCCSLVRSPPDRCQLASNLSISACVRRARRRTLTAWRLAEKNGAFVSVRACRWIAYSFASFVVRCRLRCDQASVSSHVAAALRYLVQRALDHLVTINAQAVYVVVTLVLAYRQHNTGARCRLPALCVVSACELTAATQHLRMRRAVCGAVL